MNKTLNVKTWLLLAVTSALFGCGDRVGEGFNVDIEVPLVQKPSDKNLGCEDFPAEFKLMEEKLHEVKWAVKFDTYNMQDAKTAAEQRIKYLELLKADKGC